MPSYRFCRPDDVPLLVRAIDACFGVHFPDLPPATVAGFRAEMKELAVWPSNCMVALQGEEPIAVLIGTKREREVLVLRLGVRPDHQRQGHASHLLASLSQKLAVLGPERLIAEVPLEAPGAMECFTANQYREECRYRDWRRAPAPLGEVPDELILPITAGELAEQGALEIPHGVSWERSRDTLLARQDRLRGAAIAMERIDAFVLYRHDGGGTVDVDAAVCRDDGRREVLLGLLLRWLARRHPASALRLPKLAGDELPPALLHGLGFEAGPTYARLAAVATPG
ncbi:MAG: GNAT family N-acetyltransferase [Acidobacteria bacterium]|nr:MAG: GNAT family N-acetyltransferase [Acidobacteriota bacterium]